jgi:tetratricopeptide (TPR) repeat protein
MKTRILTTVLVAALAAVVVFVVLPRFTGGPPPDLGPPLEEDTGEPYRPLQYQLTTEQSIEFFQQRTERDPQDYMTLTDLAQAHLRKAREIGDLASYDRAEAALRRALELERDYPPARAGLALVLCAQHRFAEGLRLAEQFDNESSDEGSFLLVIGDAHLEMGDYPEAEKSYEDFRGKATDEARPALLARLARLAELKGNPAEALRLMEQAAAAQREVEPFLGQGAWYQFRLGEMHFQAGRLKEAAEHYQAALQEQPRYPMALAFLGRVRAAEGKLDEAVDCFRQAVAINADLAMLADLGDLEARTGRDFLARIAHDKLERTARDRPAYDRELALFSADHDRELPRALEAARRDLTVRHDIYAHDALAWALCKNGNFKEAEKSMSEALKLGTRDASLFYHAGMIQLGLGNKDRARGLLQQALALNPHFSISQSQRARAALAELGEALPPP